VLSQELTERAVVGRAVIREAGELALDFYARRHSLLIERKGVQDPVSEADRSCEELIVRRLSGAFPNDSFLCEESGLRQRGPFLWVVDPIDGTANFVRGIGHWCVSIALLDGLRPLVGLIYDPIADETFSALAGGGAFLNDRAIGVTGQTEIANARVGIGFSYRRAVAAHTRDIGRLLDAGCEYSRLGSGALGMAYTAAGRFDGYWERHINSWDVAAGIIIVHEAGGCTNDFFENDGLAKGNEILAATPALYARLQEILQTR
jgi:myo-inositol-1(or 4)-monophosphatase